MYIQTGCYESVCNCTVSILSIRSLAGSFGGQGQGNRFCSARA